MRDFRFVRTRAALDKMAIVIIGVKSWVVARAVDVIANRGRVGLCLLMVGWRKTRMIGRDVSKVWRI